MGFFNRHKKNSAERFQFLEYTITLEPLDIDTPELSRQLGKLHNRIKRRDKRVIADLKKYIAQYPHEPILKNYLFLAYIQEDNQTVANEVLRETVAKHPDYLFGKMNLAASFLGTEELHQVPEILGKYLDLKKLHPEREVFHISEVMSFFKVVAIYFIEMEDFEAAEMRLKILQELDPRHPDTAMIEQRLEFAKAELALAILDENKLSVDSFPTVVFPPRTSPPIFQNAVIENFYRYSVKKFPEQIIEEIWAIPRDSLIADLNLVMMDTVQRYDWYRDSYKEYNENEQEFSIHALYFLGALKATDSLDVLLNVLRQGEEFLDYWYSDVIMEFWLETLYLLGEQQLDKLKQFVLEPNLYSFARSLATCIAEQVAHHQPNRREEVIQWFFDVYQGHLNDPENAKIIDSDFLSWSICSLINMRCKELLQPIEALYAKNWVYEFIVGPLKEVKKEMEDAPKAFDKGLLPKDIFDFYSQDSLDEYYLQLSEDGLLQPILDSIINEEKGFGNYQEPISHKDKPKISRNAPCLCGSGKKYKRCCIKK